MTKPTTKPTRIVHKSEKSPIRDPLTLYALDKAFQHTSKLSTPHRTPNFRLLYQLADPNTELLGSMIALEFNNTGYDGLLERWSFTLTDRIGAPASFEADLLPGLIHAPKQQ